MLGHRSIKRALPVGRVPDPVQRVDYHYAGDDGLAISPDCGTTGDLVLVVRGERVDPVAGTTAPLWRERATHYRYHRTAVDEGPLRGVDHQLKLTVESEQIEFEASAYAIAASTGVISQRGFALVLMQADDDAATYSGGRTVLELAAQVNARFETSGAFRVLEIRVSSGCGCSGGSSHRTFEYSYEASLAARGTVAVDETPGPTPGGFRRHWYETASRTGTGPQYLVARAVEELDGSHDTTHRAWITWFGRDTARILFPLSHGSSPRRTVSTSGSSGMVKVSSKFPRMQVEPLPVRLHAYSFHDLPDKRFH